MSRSLLLTKLPGELRTTIWEYALQVKPNDDDDGNRFIWLTPEPRARSSVLSLLLTCRHIHDEAEGIFYQINRLAVDTAYHYEPGPGPARLPREDVNEAPVLSPLEHLLRSLSPRRILSLHFLAIWLGEVRGKGWGRCSGHGRFKKACRRLRHVPNLRAVAFLCGHAPCTRCRNCIKDAARVVRWLPAVKELPVFNFQGCEGSRKELVPAEHSQEQFRDILLDAWWSE